VHMKFSSVNLEERSRCRYEYNTKMVLKEIGCEKVVSFYVASYSLYSGLLSK
jgi:hypothetical protein